MSKGDPAIEKAKEESEERDIEEEKSLAAPEEEGEEGEIVRDEDILLFDPKLLEEAPPKVKRAIIEMSFQMMRMGGPAYNPVAAAVAKVLDGEHLTGLIKSVDRSTELEHSNAQQARRTNLLCLIAVLVFAGFALWLLKDSSPDLLKDLIAIAATAAGGVGAGVGYMAWRQQQRR